MKLNKHQTKRAKQLARAVRTIITAFHESADDPRTQKTITICPLTLTEDSVPDGLRRSESSVRVKLKMGQEQITVLATSYQANDPLTFKTGLWTVRIDQLEAEALALTKKRRSAEEETKKAAKAAAFKENFGPVEDQNLFSDIADEMALIGADILTLLRQPDDRSADKMDLPTPEGQTKSLLSVRRSEGTLRVIDQPHSGPTNAHTVYSASENNPGAPDVFLPGTWQDVLGEWAKGAGAKRDAENPTDQE